MTVQVTDVSSGAGGTATIQFRTPAAPAPGHQQQPGGNQPTQSKSPSGSDQGKHGKRPAGKTGAQPSGSSDKGRSTTHPAGQSTTPATASPPSTSTAPAQPTTPTPTTAAPATATAAPAGPAGHAAPRRPAAHPRPRHATTRRSPPPAPAGPLVTGRLISDVTPLPVGSSPLVHVTPAAVAAPPAVRQATRTTTLSALGAALVVIVLLGLGAWRELRGRRCRPPASPAH